MSLPDPPNVIDVMRDVVDLHLNHTANSDLLLLFIWPPDEYVLFPGIRYLSYQLDNVTAIGVEKRQ